MIKNNYTHVYLYNIIDYENIIIL